MTEQERLIKIYIDLPENETVGGEAVWAKPIGNDLYEIRNSPWHAYDIHFGDVVKALSLGQDKKPIFSEVIKRSGHKTLRIFFSEGADEEGILKKLKEMNASHEKAWNRFYAIDAEPDGDYQLVCDYLWSLEQKGILEYETGTTQEENAGMPNKFIQSGAE